MFTFLKKWFGGQDHKPHATIQVLIRDVSIEELKLVISKFAHEKPKGVPLSVLVGENNEIDYSLLLPFLAAMPRQTFYMSKETYEIFTDQNIAMQVDCIQQAVDDYVDSEGKLPVLEEDLLRRVNYQKLRPYLRINPTIETYLTMDENLITTKEPSYH